MSKETTPATKADITRLEGRIEKLEQRMHAFESRMDAFEARMDRFEQRLQVLEQKFDAFDAKITARTERLWEDIDRVILLLGNIQGKLDGRVEDHEKRIARLEVKVGVAD